MTTPAAALAAVRTALETAVRELVTDTIVSINRDHPDDPDVAALAAEHREQAQRAADDLAAARDRDDRHAERLARLRLLDLDTEHRARVAARGWTPSLLQQLADAVGSSSGAAPGASGAPGAPIRLDAAELLADIARTVSARPVDNLALRLRSWAGLAGHWQTENPDQLRSAAAAATRWVHTARALLDPGRVTPLAGRCPGCRRRTTHEVDELGEHTERPVLQLHRDAGIATCTLPCTETWGPERLRWLGELLWQQDAEEDGGQDPATRGGAGAVDGTSARVA